MLNVGQTPVIVSTARRALLNVDHSSVTKLLQGAFLHMCNEVVSFSQQLKVIGVVSLTVDGSDQDIVVKINNTLRRVAPNDKQTVPDVGRPLPTGGQPVANVGQPVPNGRQMLPNVGQPVPNGRQMLPNVGQPVPNGRQPLPNVGQPMPNGQQPLTNVGQPVPNGRQPLSNEGQPLPNERQPLPNVGQPLPSGRQLQSVPDLGHHVPNVEQPVPTCGQSVPVREQPLLKGGQPVHMPHTRKETFSPGSDQSFCDHVSGYSSGPDTPIIRSILSKPPLAADAKQESHSFNSNGMNFPENCISLSDSDDCESVNHRNRTLCRNKESGQGEKTGEGSTTLSHVSIDLADDSDEMPIFAGHGIPQAQIFENTLDWVNKTKPQAEQLGSKHVDEGNNLRRTECNMSVDNSESVQSSAISSGYTDPFGEINYDINLMKNDSILVQKSISASDGATNKVKSPESSSSLNNSPDNLIKAQEKTLLPHEITQYLGRPEKRNFFTKCPKCTEVFTSVLLYIEHTLKIHNVYICHYSKCRQEFSSKEHLMRHRLVHTHSRQSIYPLPTTKRIAATNLKPHEISKYLGAEDKNFFTTCPECTEVFRSVFLYVAHTLDAHRSYICHTCHQKFAVKESLLRHRLIHTGKRKFACRICQKSFYRKDKCKEHIKKHLTSEAAKSAGK